MQLEIRENVLTKEEEEQSIDLLELFNMLKGKIIWIVAFAMLGAVIAYAYSSFFITPLYSATAVVYVNSRKDAVYVDSISSNEITTSAKLVPTYQAIVSTKTAMRRAIEERGIEGYTPAQLLGMISTSADEDTGVFYITARGADQFYVADIANAVAEVGILEMSKYIEGTTANIIDYAVVPERKSYPSSKKNTAAGFVLGAALSAGVILIYGFMDVRIKKTETFSKVAGVPVLGIIPDLDDKSHNHDGSYRVRNKTQQGESRI